MENLSLVSVRLPNELVRQIEKKADQHGYFTKSDFIRAACKLLLVAESNHNLYDDIFDLSRSKPTRSYNVESV